MLSSRRAGVLDSEPPFWARDGGGGGALLRGVDGPVPSRLDGDVRPAGARARPVCRPRGAHGRSQMWQVARGRRPGRTLLSRAVSQWHPAAHPMRLCSSLAPIAPGRGRVRSRLHRRSAASAPVQVADLRFAHALRTTSALHDGFVSGQLLALLRGTTVGMELQRARRVAEHQVSGDEPVPNRDGPPVPQRWVGQRPRPAASGCSRARTRADPRDSDRELRGLRPHPVAARGPRGSVLASHLLPSAAHLR